MRRTPAARKAPALIRYYGGKQRLARWIVSRFPRGQETWVEPFGGGLSTVLAAIDYHRPRRVVVAEARPQLRALYRLVRDDPAEARRRWRFYHSRGIGWLGEHRLADIEDPVLWALRLAARSGQVLVSTYSAGLYSGPAWEHLRAPTRRNLAKAARTGRVEDMDRREVWAWKTA